jgi:hypothetical protein
MKLPYGDKVIIDKRKVVDYCLSPDHDDGKHKARLFEHLLGLKREHSYWGNNPSFGDGLYTLRQQELTYALIPSSHIAGLGCGAEASS